MRYRELSPTGDYVFGQGSQEFLVNSPQCVAQAVGTRLKLLQGEWFLDVTAGTPYSTQVLGTHTQATYDIAIQNEILGTEGVLSISNYTSNVDTVTRALGISATIDTIYGQTELAQSL